MSKVEKAIYAALALAVIGLALMAYFTDAHAAECVSPEQLTAKAKQELPNVQVSQIGKSIIPGAVQRYNDHPPKSAVVADQMLVFHDESLPKFGVYFFSNGCLTGFAGVTQAALTELLGQET